MSSSDTLRDVLIGGTCVFFGELFFATNNAVVKWSAMTLTQLLFSRFIIQLLIAIAWWNIKHCKAHNNDTSAAHEQSRWYGNSTRDIVNIWARGSFYGLSMLTEWYAVLRMPIGDTYCIFYQVPLFMSISTWLVLNEPLSKLTPLIAVLGFVAIAFITQPTFLTRFYYQMASVFHVQTAQHDVVEPLPIDGVIAVFVSMIAWSVVVVLTRMAKEAHFVQIEIASATQNAFVWIPLAAILNAYWLQNEAVGDWTAWTFDARAVCVSVVVGVLGFTALSLNVIGYQQADVTKVGWVAYVNIAFAFVYQSVLFRDAPNTMEIIGIVFVVIVSSLTILEECYKHRQDGGYERVTVDDTVTSASELEDESQSHGANC